MTTDLSPSGIQRLLEICDGASEGVSALPMEYDDKTVGADWLLVTAAGTVAAELNRDDAAFFSAARTALPDALRRISALEEAMKAIIDRSNNRELGTGKVPDMREIAVRALAGGSGK